MLKEFREFVMRGNVVDLAVGIVVGAAFSQIANSLVNDIIMPPIGLILSRVDFSNLYISLSGEQYRSLVAAQEAGAATLNYGLFINAVINFLVVAFAVFLLVRVMNRLQRQEEAPPEPTTKDCPYCYTSIPLKAARCPNCTSQLE